jgi:hypothetical protein
MKSLIVFLFAFPLAAYATGTPPPPPHDPSQEQEQGQAQEQSQAQDQAQGQEQGQSQSASADNAGNSQVVNFEDRKQAPSIGQGSIFIPECGAGGNGGGSSSNGSAFFGIAYVPAWCQDFKYAAFLMAAGEYEAACQVMAASKPGKRAAKRGIELPACAKPQLLPAKPEPVQPVPTVIVLQGESCAARERAERVFENCVSK